MSGHHEKKKKSHKKSKSRHKHHLQDDDHTSSQPPLTKKSRQADADDFEDFVPPEDSSLDEDDEYIDDIRGGGRRTMKSIIKRKQKRQQHELLEDDDEPTNTTAATSRHQQDDEFVGGDYRGVLDLKRDHNFRPIWVTPNALIILETHSPLYKKAHDFLLAISEPVSRPEHMHEYKLTSTSLCAAVSVGLRTEEIIRYLDFFCKTTLPPDIVKYVAECTANYGKAKLVLRHNRYFIESIHLDHLRMLTRNARINECLVKAPPTSSSATAAASNEDQTVVNVEHGDSTLDSRLKPFMKLQQSGGAANQSEGVTGSSSNAIGGGGADSAVGGGGVGNDGDQLKGDTASALSEVPEDMREYYQCIDAQLDNEEEDDEDYEEEEVEEENDNEEEGKGEGEEEDDEQHVQHMQEMEDVEEHQNAARARKTTKTKRKTKKMKKRKKKPTYSVEIRADRIQIVQQECIAQECGLLSEYDFRNDTRNPDIRISLKSNTSLRPYQEFSLRKMFGNGRARSGIIVLPCGAGKTLVGVTAACTVRKRCLCLCSGGVAVEQWRSQFKLWSTAEDKQICRFSGNIKDRPTTHTEICISTYSIIGYQGKRSDAAEELIKWLQRQEWGLILLDEVHTLPAKMFREVLNIVQGHCKLGLTATLVREDDKIINLNFLVGPKLYEANWLELERGGFIARVQCAEVRCPMTPEFYREYLSAASSGYAMLLWVMNPNKFRTCAYLIRRHEARHDKIIVFSDNLFALRYYATALHRPFLEGATSVDERLKVMENFRHNPNINTIFVSKMADIALDLPEATVLIQISSHGGSRRQEAQRLGRISRAKRGMRPNEYSAYFYTLVSEDTTEMAFSVKRQRFLVNQGYSYKVITQFANMEREADLGLATKTEQLELLARVLAAKEEDGQVERFAGAVAAGEKAGGAGGGSRGGGAAVKREPTDVVQHRVASSLAALSTNQKAPNVYIETQH